MPKTILLLSQFSQVQRWVIDFLRQKNVKKIAYIIDGKKPAIERNSDYVFNDKITFEKSGFEIDVIELGKLQPAQLEQAFADCEAIYVKGGNTFYLLDAMKKSGFDKFAQDLLNRGVIYVGESAGAYVACPNIEMAHWGAQDKNIVDLKDLTALNFVDFQLLVHYTKEFEPIMQKDIEASSYEVRRLTNDELLLIEEENEVKITL